MTAVRTTPRAPAPTDSPDARPAARRESWSARFSTSARTVADAARAIGLDVPGFRAPPGRSDADRTLRRWADGRCVVAVRVAGRPHEAVVDDLIAGVVAANRLSGRRARLAAERLHLAVSGGHTRTEHAA